ncbi:HTH CENPB-type domain-containing protein, partial [Trichonephila clavipes]
GLFEEVEDSGLQSDDEYHLDEKKGRKLIRMIIPLDYKIKMRGGSTKDKYTTIDKWTHDRFVEARQSNQQVTTRNLQQWALAAASQFPGFEFKASEAWVKIFKRKTPNSTKKITKFVSERETATMERPMLLQKSFYLHTRAPSSNYDKRFCPQHQPNRVPIPIDVQPNPSQARIEGLCLLSGRI